MAGSTGRAIVAVVMLLGGGPGCTRKEEPPPAPELVCKPQVLAAGSSLRLEFQANHASELAVIDPQGRFFLLAFGEQLAGIEPMVERRLFQRMAELEIDPNEAEAAFRGSGGLKSRIFTRPGRYEVRLGENLRGEHPQLAGQCSVELGAAASAP